MIILIEKKKKWEGGEKIWKSTRVKTDTIIFPPEEMKKYIKIPTIK